MNLPHVGPKREKSQLSVHHLAKLLRRALNPSSGMCREGHGSPHHLWDRFLTSQGTSAVPMVSVVLEDVDKAEMPPEESNWNRNWKLGQRKSS